MADDLPDGLSMAPPAQANQLPDGLSLAPPQPAVQPGFQNLPAVAPPHNDPVADRMFTGTVAGRMLDAIGQGARQGWGTDQIGPSEDSLRQIGLGIDPGRKDWWNPIKSINENIIRPLAVGALGAFDLAGHAFSAAVGGVSGAAASALIEAGARPDGNINNMNDYQQTVERGTQDFSEFLNMAALVSGMSETGIPRAAASGRTVSASEASRAAEETAPPIGTPPNVGPNLGETTTGKPTTPPTSETVLPQSAPLADKAGNLNLNYINTPDDVKQLLVATADKADDFNQERGFYSDNTNAKTSSDAEAILAKATTDVTTGIPDFMTNLQNGQVFTKAEDTAARMWITQTGAETQRLAKVAATTGQQTDVDAYVTMEQRLKLAMGIDNQSAAEVARMQQARQIPVGEREGLGEGVADAVQKLEENETLDPMARAKIIAQMDTPQQAAAFLNDSRKANWKDMGLEFVMNNFLSGPITHKAYVISNAINTMLRVGVETPVAALIGKMRGRMTDPGEIAAMQAERAGLADRLAESTSSQGRPMSAADAVTAQSRISDIDSKLSDTVPVLPAEVGARIVGALRGSRDAIVNWPKLKAAFKDMDPKSAAQAFGDGPVFQSLKSGEAGLLPGEKPYTPGGGGAPPTFVRNAIPGPLGTVIRIPSRVIGGIHTFQKVAGYTEAMNGLAYRQASIEGLEGSDLTNRVTQLLAKPDPDMMATARNQAAYSSLMAEPGEFGQAFENLANVNHGTKMVITFARVANNIIKQGLIERTPVGLISEKLRDDLSGLNGEAVQNTAAARMAVGTTIALGVTGLALSGHATGPYPSDPNERRFDHDLLGQPAYSVKIGNWWIADRHLGPIGPIIATGANLGHAALQAKDGDLMDGASVFAVSQAKYALEESPLDGMANLMEAVDDPDRKGKSYLSQTLTSALLPFSSFTSQTAHAIDPYLRQVNNLTQAAASKEPFLSQTLTPRIDVFGQPVQAGDDMGQRYANDPLVGELKRLSLFPAMPDKSVFQVKLNDQQYTNYMSMAGTNFYSIANEQMQNPDWNSYTDFERYEYLDKSLAAARKMARDGMAMAYPDLIDQSAQQKQDLVDGVTKPGKRK